MVFAEQIRELLDTKECVIIPGMGAFITHYTPAEIREDNNHVAPPSKDLGFNAELTEDDGLLVSFLATYLGKSAEEAEALIAKEVATVFDTLTSGKTYLMKDIGVFSRSKDGLMSFKADMGTNFHLDSYGLSSFIFPGLETEKQSVFSNPIIFRTPVRSRLRESLPGTRNKKVADKYTSAFVGIALLTFLVISLVPYNARVSDAIFRHPASLGPLPSLTELDPPVEEVNKIANEPMVQPADIQLSDLYIEKTMYPVVAGSFQNRINAEKLASELKSLDYSSRIEATRSFFRVILKEYENLREAELELPALQQKHPQLELWIKK